jgi:coatomer subunit beta
MSIGYTLVYEPNTASKKTLSEFKTLLEKGRDDSKIDTMKKILVTMLNGDLLPDLLMHIIRFVMPLKNKELKKLLYFYWEIVPKLDASGKMRQEMILVCNAIQRDLQHPNEYVRGNTLRFLNKLREPDLLETLVPNVRQCLEHRHAYVRKNAVFALYLIHRVGEHLVPDADELIYRFLYNETDSACKRNAFVCLGDLNRDAALRYMQDNLLNLEQLDLIVQIAFVDFMKRDARTADEALRQLYCQIVAEIVESSSNNVVTYEAATALTAMSNALSSVVLAGTKFVDLATKEADNNVKMITLERINELHRQHPGVLQGLSLEILRVLNCQDLDVRKKALEVTLQFVTLRNVEDVVKLLKKELQRTTASTDEDNNNEYRQLLINAIHQLAIKFVEVAANVVDLLLELMSDLNTTAAYEVVVFVKEVVEKFPDLRQLIVARLIANLDKVHSGKVFRGSLWIIGEYCEEEKLVQEAWKYLRGSIGEVPIISSERRKQHEDEEVKESKPTKKRGPVINPDGTYATENALTVEAATILEEDPRALRRLILQGDFYLAAVLLSTLVKLILHLQRISQKEAVLNALKAEALLVMVSILRVGQDPKYVSKRIDEDSADRIFSCINYLTDDANAELISKSFLDATRDAFKTQVESEERKKLDEEARVFHKNAEQVDDAIAFEEFPDTRQAARASTQVGDATDLLSSALPAVELILLKLDKILPLTGYLDPIYCEAYVKVHQYDVVLDVLLVNQTTSTLRNLSVEFATLGDLKVVDKPATANIGPHGFHKVQTTIKVTLADTGVIFGNIVYDGQHLDDLTIVILNDVHVDIMDYIKPATCSENAFRKMWNEFEWENKITIKLSMQSLGEYLEELLRGTNMKCLTPLSDAECQFLLANLYLRSSFGEDALANLCIEKQDDGPIIGHVRIRLKGQGLALSLGDRVASILRKTAVKAIV